LNADINADLALNFGLAEGGAGGGIDANVHVSLADPTGDLRVHFDEVVERYNIMPLCVFDVGGTLTAGLHAYVTVGVKPLSHTWTFDGPSATLIDFSFPCLGPGDAVPVLARIESGDARLHIGPDAFRRIVGNVSDSAETFTVSHRAGAAGAEQIGVSYAVTGSTGGALGVLGY
jgi:hypothetical protein